VKRKRLESLQTEDDVIEPIRIRKTKMRIQRNAIVMQNLRPGRRKAKKGRNVPEREEVVA
jgi:hypothetical protein